MFSKVDSQVLIIYLKQQIQKIIISKDGLLWSILKNDLFLKKGSEIAMCSSFLAFK